MPNSRMTVRLAGFISTGLLLVAAGCGKVDAIDDGQSVLNGGGFKIENPHSVPPAPFSAVACRQEKVEGLDVVLCSYASTDARQRGEKAMEGWAATAITGSFVPRDLPEGRAAGGARWLLLGLADRTRADLSGKTIQKIVKAWKKN